MKTLRELAYLMVAACTLIGVKVTLSEIQTFPNSSVGLISLPSNGLIIITLCVCSLFYIIGKEK